MSCNTATVRPLHLLSAAAMALCLHMPCLAQQPAPNWTRPWLSQTSPSDPGQINLDQIGYFSSAWEAPFEIVPINPASGSLAGSGPPGNRLLTRPDTWRVETRYENACFTPCLIAYRELQMFGANGEKRWRRSLPVGRFDIGSTVSVSELTETLLFAHKSDILAMDPASGRIRWQRAYNGANIVAMEHGVFWQVDLAGDRVFKLDEQGRQLWLHAMSQRLLDMEVAPDGSIHLLSRNGANLNWQVLESEGAELHSVNLLRATTELSPKLIPLSAHSAYLSSIGTDGQYWIERLRSGADPVLWQRQFAAAPQTRSFAVLGVTAQNHLLVDHVDDDLDEQLMSLDSEDGSTRWSQSPDRPDELFFIHSLALFAREHTYLPDAPILPLSGAVGFDGPKRWYGLDLDSGNILWRRDTLARPSRPSVATLGLVDSVLEASIVHDPSASTNMIELVEISHDGIERRQRTIPGITSTDPRQLSIFLQANSDRISLGVTQLPNYASGGIVILERSTLEPLLQTEADERVELAHDHGHARLSNCLAGGCTRVDYTGSPDAGPWTLDLPAGHLENMTLSTGVLASSTASPTSVVFFDSGGAEVFRRALLGSAYASAATAQAEVILAVADGSQTSLELIGTLAGQIGAQTMATELGRHIDVSVVDDVLRLRGYAASSYVLQSRFYSLPDLREIARFSGELANIQLSERTGMDDSSLHGMVRIRDVDMGGRIDAIQIGRESGALLSRRTLHALTPDLEFSMQEFLVDHQPGWFLLRDYARSWGMMRAGSLRGYRLARSFGQVDLSLSVDAELVRDRLLTIRLHNAGPDAARGWLRHSNTRSIANMQVIGCRSPEQASNCELLPSEGLPDWVHLSAGSTMELDLQLQLSGSESALVRVRIDPDADSSELQRANNEVQIAVQSALFASGFED